MPDPAVDLKNRRLAAFLAFLVPGLGHFYQRRTGKGVLYLVCILGLYGIGFALGEGKNVYWSWVNPMKDPDNFRIHYLGQMWVGIPSLLALLQATLIHYGQIPLFRGFMAAPMLDPSMSAATRTIIEGVVRDVNGLFDRYGKLVEIGALYTTVAGLLNILAIYDAYDGPAHGDEEEDAGTTVAESSKSESAAVPATEVP